ncbi:MAG: hypothetical protein F7B60_05200 [Desulfurococcales archaeon]|nr:hypothetical protein [Desulfurococcales archaeon]
MAKEDLESAIESIPRLWARGNMLVLFTIIVEASRKTLWYTGLIVNETLNNIFVGSSLFLGMLAGLDLLRVYVYISWINDLAFELSLYKYSQGIDGNFNAFLNKAERINTRNLMEGILMTSITFLLWVSIPIGISKINRSLGKLGVDKRLNKLTCYTSLLTGCKTSLEEALSELRNEFDNITLSSLETPSEDI